MSTEWRPPASDGVISYAINHLDQIVTVGESWDAFSDANEGVVRAAGIVGHSVWEFVSHDTTRQVYRDLIARVHSGHRVQFAFRCDSPTLRRFMRMSMSPGPDASVLFDSQVLRTEPRDAPILTVDPAIQTGDLLRMCGWCRRVAVAADEWVEIEIAVDRLGILAHDPAVGVTHGMCPDCFTRVVGEVDAA